MLPKAIKILTEANRLFKTNSKDKSYYDTPEFNQNVELLRNIFPKARAGGNNPARGSFKETKERMIKFFDAYPEYQNKWQLILDATAQYVESFRNNYQYMTTSTYFIMKDNFSKLAAECENYDAKDNQLSEADLDFYKIVS